MIDFTPDSPFLKDPDPLFPSRVRVIGLGQTGVAACDQMTMFGQVSQDIWALDTDRQVVEGSVVSQRRLLAAEKIRGLGCSGDIAFARQMAGEHKEIMEDLTQGCDFIILVLSLAGATGTALAEILIPLAQEKGIKVMALAVPPLACESPRRQEQSRQTLAMLRQEAESVLVLPLEVLAESAPCPHDLRSGFHAAHKLLASTAQALTQMVCKRGLIQLSFADVRSLFGRYVDVATMENCWVAQMESDLRDSAEEMVEELLTGPMLGDPSMWSKVDQAMVVISGPRELGLSEVQEIVVALQQSFPIQLPVFTSASMEEESHGEVKITLLLARTTTVEQPIPETKFKPLTTSSLTKTSSGTLATTAWKKTPEPKINLPVIKVIVPEVPIESVTKEEFIAEYETGPLAVPVASKSGRYLAKQEEMHFEPMTRGRFEHSQETIYHGENLDQPTFRRRRLAIRL